MGLLQDDELTAVDQLTKHTTNLPFEFPRDALVLVIQYTSLSRAKRNDSTVICLAYPLLYKGNIP